MLNTDFIKNLPYKPFLFTGLWLLFFFIAIGFSGKKQSKKHINDVVVKILNQDNNYFIDNLEILDLINAENTDYVLGLNVGQLNLKELEKRVEKHPFVKEVQVFKDLKGNLLVEVIQTRAVARIFDPKGKDYYIDEGGNVLPVTAKHTARVPLVELADKSFLNENLNKNEEGKKLYELLTFIDQNKFWNAQIAHLFVSQDFEVNMLTQVSKQKIEFGKIENIEKKFKKLNVCYKKILPVKGWNAYDTVSLQFNGQIVLK